MLEWKDVTGYTQGDTRRVPKAFAATLDTLTVRVGRDHIKHKNKWVLECGLWPEELVLGDRDGLTLDQCKRMAGDMVARKLNKCLHLIRA